MSTDELAGRARYEIASGRLLDSEPLCGPDIWYVECYQADGEQLTIDLVAFVTHHFPRGMVVTNDEFEGMPVKAANQVGAIRWDYQTGQTKTIYVQPERRRTGIGLALIRTADAHQIAAGRPPLWGNGHRTDLGEVFLKTLSAPGRIAPRQSVAAPMTPPERATDLPDRLLNPDPGSL